MNILKNAEISRKYNVSPAAVTGWVQNSQQGKNNLQLTKLNGKFYVLDNDHNQAEIFRLAGEGKKYRSHLSVKKVEVKPEFYEIFNEEEIIEITNDLEFKRQINLKYAYKNGGAKYCDELYLSGSSPIKYAINDLTSISVDDIGYLFDNPDKINIIDIGPGNAYPCKHLLEEFNKKGILNSYIAIDISSQMNVIAVDNVKSWFPNIPTYSYERDFEVVKFGKIFLENKSSPGNIANLILYIGNTICNIDDKVQVLKNLRSGMSQGDLLVVSFTLDNNDTRSTLNYQKTAAMNFQHAWIPELIGIDVNECKFQVQFNPDGNYKEKDLVLDKDYVLVFNVLGRQKFIELQAGEGINTWKHYVLNLDNFLADLSHSELQVLNVKIDKTISYASIICQAINK